jgi:hypothetical protein
MALDSQTLEDEAGGRAGFILGVSAFSFVILRVISWSPSVDKESIHEFTRNRTNKTVNSIQRHYI